MSEYQYYEFLAIDRPLDKAAQNELRALSSRARITATTGYDRAAGLLLDLKAVAEEHDAAPDFARRVVGIPERHAGKARFLQRIANFG